MVMFPSMPPMFILFVSLTPLALLGTVFFWTTPELALLCLDLPFLVSHIRPRGISLSLLITNPTTSSSACMVEYFNDGRNCGHVCCCSWLPKWLCHRLCCCRSVCVRGPTLLMLFNRWSLLLVFIRVKKLLPVLSSSARSCLGRLSGSKNRVSSFLSINELSWDVDDRMKLCVPNSINAGTLAAPSW